jgi:hypothetical protein
MYYTKLGVSMRITPAHCSALAVLLLLAGYAHPAASKLALRV